MIENLEKWCKDNGYSLVFPKDETKIVTLLENPFNTQIIVGEEFSVNERYTYTTSAEAFMAFVRWTQQECEGEPDGWIRHQPSNRRREGGDPNKETIRE